MCTVSDYRRLAEYRPVWGYAPAGHKCGCGVPVPYDVPVLCYRYFDIYLCPGCSPAAFKKWAALVHRFFPGFVAYPVRPVVPCGRIVPSTLKPSSYKRRFARRYYFRRSGGAKGSPS